MSAAAFVLAMLAVWAGARAVVAWIAVRERRAEVRRLYPFSTPEARRGAPRPRK